jgi:hypothetical protein
MPIQNVIGSVPVSAKGQPPEGQMAAQLSFLLTPTEPSIAAALQLSSQSGLMLSQVVTLAVDNSDNSYPVNVTHGIFNESTIVPAFGSVILPTFSSKSNYPINVAAVIPAGQTGLTINVQVNIIFMNYARTPGSFGTTQSNCIIGGGQNVGPLLSGFISATAAGNYIILEPGNYILDNLDIFCTNMASTVATNQALCEWTLLSIQNGVSLAVIASAVDVVAGAYSTTVGTPGGVFTAPVSITWPQGLILPRGCLLVFQVITLENCTAQYRFNGSGFATP